MYLLIARVNMCNRSVPGSVVLFLLPIVTCTIIVICHDSLITDPLTKYTTTCQTSCFYCRVGNYICPLPHSYVTDCGTHSMHKICKNNNFSSQYHLDCIYLQVITGACSSGRNGDCKRQQHAIECCQVANWKE